MRLSRVVLSLALIAGVARAGEAQIVRSTTTSAPSAGVVVGYVTAKESGLPLGYADVSVSTLGRATLADQNGRFVLPGVPIGPVELRVRRLGYTPGFISVTVRAEGADTVRVALSALAIQLGSVRVSAPVCPQGRQGDSAVTAILQQVQLNAERNALLSRSYPFVGTVERSFSRPVVVSAGDPISTRRVVARVDTISEPSAREWRYAPGKIVVREGDADAPGAGQQFVIPELGDLADPPFVEAHCFRYAGLSTMDGKRMIRVDFEPSSAVKVPDVTGSLYLDTLTYQLRHSTITHERRDPERVVQVESWFRELRAGVPVLDSVVGRVTSRSSTRVAAAGPRGRPEMAMMPVSVIQTETHRLLSVRFVGARPELDQPVTLRSTATRLSVEGVAFDSLRLKALAGATIRMDDEQHVTRTDSAGRFTFDDVSAGPHRFVLEHPTLSALGLAGVQASLNVSGALGTFAIATPSFAQLWRMFCGQRPAPSDSGFVLGTLADARSRQAVSGATVMLTWAEARTRLEEDGGGVRQWEGVFGSDDGRFAVCGVPRNSALRIAAFDDSTTSGSRLINLRDERIITVELAMQRALPAAEPTPTAAGATVTPGNPRSPIRLRLAELRRIDSQRRFDTDDMGRMVRRRPLFADSSSIGPGGSWAAVLSRFDSVHVEGRDGRLRQVTLPRFLRHGTEMRLDATAGRCNASLVIDRRPLNPRFLDVLRLTDIAAIEFYLGPDDVPPQFAPLSAECGMFVIWTKDVLF